MQIKKLMIQKDLSNSSITIDGKNCLFSFENILKEMWSVLHKTDITNKDMQYLFSRYEEHFSFLVKQLDLGLKHPKDIVINTDLSDDHRLDDAIDIVFQEGSTHAYIFSKTREILYTALVTKNVKGALFMSEKLAKNWVRNKKGLMGKTVVVLINGYNGVGKDTLVDSAKSVTSESIHNISTVDKIKEAAVILGWNGVKDDTSRAALHDLKKLSNKYFNHSRSYVENFTRQHSNCFIFVHCREPLELEYFKKFIPEVKPDTECYSLLVTNDRVTPADNAADQGVFEFTYDFIVKNNSTIEDLKLEARRLLETIMEE